VTTPTPRSSGDADGVPALLLQGVVKTFGETRAVDGLDLDVPAGTCLGLLGPNGAGKSTTMRMLTGQAIPDAGTIQVLGYDVPRESKQARARMGVVPQRENLDEELTCSQNLMVWATLLRVPRRRRDAAVASALEAAQLVDRADAKVSTLSGGMRRRLLIARALVHDPALVLLDEPTVGLDPQVRGDIWTLIDRLRSQGVTVLMSTHYIEEAERLCDDVAVVSHGKVIARGTPSALVAEHAGVEALEVYGPPPRLERAEALVQEHGFATRRTGPSVSVLRAEALPAALLDELGGAVRRPANLEDVFVLLTGEKLEG
jgi:lipooligosaccharide transport system ATP-binding protein